MSPRTNFFWIESIQGKKFWYSEISESKRLIRIYDDADDDDFLRINDDADAICIAIVIGITILVRFLTITRSFG